MPNEQCKIIDDCITAYKDKVADEKKYAIAKMCGDNSNTYSAWRSKNIEQAKLNLYFSKAPYIEMDLKDLVKEATGSAECYKYLGALIH
jgi:hypothetical protein